LPITEKELELLEALTRTKKLKDAAKLLGISPSTAGQRLQRVRRKYKEALKIVRVVERAMLRMPKKFLEVPE